MKTIMKFCIFLVVAMYANLVYADRDNGVDNSLMAENCRRMALQLDNLSRMQDRPSCQTNLDGASLYVASRYIFEGQLKEAYRIISKSLILTQFSIDIECYGKSNLMTIASQLGMIQDQLAKQLNIKSDKLIPKVLD